MKRTVDELAAFLGGRLSGAGEILIDDVAELESAGPGDLTYAEGRFLEKAPSSRASCILVAGGEFPGLTTITVSRPKAAFARAAAWLFPPARPDAGVHASAVVAGSVRLGNGVHVGPHAVLDDGVQIGDNTVIHAGCHLARASTVGRDSTFFANVVLYPETVVGSRVVVHAGAVLGADGFGFVRDGDGYIPFPQRGSIEIEDDVEIGANSTIDRGSLGQTLIGRGTKIDNLVHIAHNVLVGTHTVIAAQTGVSGSCRIGGDVVIAGQVGVADHVRIDSGAVVGAQCGIPSGKRIRAGKVFWGTPARPLDDIKIQQAHIARLPRMAEELAELRKVVERLIEQQENNQQ
jgi:UDP-3-O-[3-hydroxymyristoyl] glucosamine N-acyltransferase